jgi:hypothetical protein
VPEIFRRPPTEDQHRAVVVNADILEGQVGFGAVALALDIRVPSRFEIVDDEMQPPVARRGDSRLETRLQQTMARIEALVALAGIARDDENAPGHRLIVHAKGKRGKRGLLVRTIARLEVR